MPVLLQTQGGNPVPATVGDLIAAVHDHLQGTYRSEYNTLLSPMAATDTTLSVTGPLAGIARTAWLSIDDEIVYVQSTTAATGTAQVIRGWDGTTPAAHTAGTPIEVQPRFPRHMIRRALALEINAWPDTIFQTAEQTITLVANGITSTYDFGIPSAQVLYLLDARHGPWSALNRNSWAEFAQPCRLIRNADPTSFPSGLAIKVTDSIGGNVPMRVTYATPFVTTNMNDTTLAGPGGIGLAPSMLDVAALGAASRLIGPREAMRTFGEASGQERDDQAVPAGGAIRVGAYLRQEAQRRLAEEVTRLFIAWPIRVK